MISTEMPSRSSCAAATSARCTIAQGESDFAASLTTRALPKGRLVRAGIFGTIVGLTIQMLVLEEHHGIIATG